MPRKFNLVLGATAAALALAIVAARVSSWNTNGRAPTAAPRPTVPPSRAQAIRVPPPSRPKTPWCIFGANNYYLTYKSKKMVDDVLLTAKKLGLNVVRTWGFIDRGSLDGSIPSVDGAGHKDGIYFQYWDPVQRRPAYNDGASGLARLDYVLHKARELDLRLIIVLTNNWRHFGGMDQYLEWFGLTYHDEFYTHPAARRAFKNWVAHLLQRKNSIDGVVYRDDPAIFAWELANEPRCTNDSPRDRFEGWDSKTITTWADEMSQHVKSLAPNHLVSVGDEGFLMTGGSDEFYRGKSGVDHESLLGLQHVDFGTYHLFPYQWKTTPEWGTKWIQDHVAVARKVGKPTVLEEYGWKPEEKPNIDASLEIRRAEIYSTWNRAVWEARGNGSLVWMLAGRDDSGKLYAEHDGYPVYHSGATARAIRTFSARFANEQCPQ